MINFEKYKSKIEEFDGAFAVNVHTLEARPCNGKGCHDCLFRPSNPAAPTLRCTDKLIKWLCEEYKEPSVDWSNVPIDTKVLVSDYGTTWYKRHFAGVDSEGEPLVYPNGTTSWSAGDIITRGAYKFTKLAEEE